MISDQREGRHLSAPSHAPAHHHMLAFEEEHDDARLPGDAVHKLSELYMHWWAKPETQQTVVYSQNLAILDRPSC